MLFKRKRAKAKKIGTSEIKRFTSPSRRSTKGKIIASGRNAFDLSN